MGNYCCQDTTLDFTTTTQTRLKKVDITAQQKTINQSEKTNSPAQSTIDKFFPNGSRQDDKTIRFQRVRLTPLEQGRSIEDITSIARKPGSEMESHTHSELALTIQGFHKQNFPDGSYYEGEWRNNKREGKGKLVYPSGDFYEGEWMGDKANGHGRFESKSGYTYEGGWLDDKEEGEGQEHYENGAVYKGQFHQGKKCGSGRLEDPDGSYYSGQFRDNEFNGKGEYVWSHQRYKGDWEHSQMHGQGVCQWKDGRKYVGQYIRGKKHGYGEFSWPDGRCFKGEWRNGCRLKGTLIYPDGTTKLIGDSLSPI